MTACQRHAGLIKLLHDHQREQGKHMSDTIDLLETIGRDASLRHASVEELSNMLELAQASEALMSAAVHGDSSLLSAELGNKPMKAPQITQSPSHQDDESEQDVDDEADHSPAPDHHMSSSAQ
jgi:hypothetical protein